MLFLSSPYCSVTHDLTDARTTSRSQAPVCWGYLTVHPRLEFADQNKQVLEDHVDSKNTAMLIPLWEKYGRLRIAHPTRPGSRLLTPGGLADRKPQSQEDRHDWIEEVVQSIKTHIKLGLVRSLHPGCLCGVFSIDESNCGLHMCFQSDVACIIPIKMHTCTAKDVFCD